MQNNILKFKRKEKTGALINGIYYDTTRWKKCDDCIYCQSLPKTGEYGICLFNYQNGSINDCEIKHCVHKEYCENFEEKKSCNKVLIFFETLFNHINVNMIYNYEKYSTIKIIKVSFKNAYNSTFNH